MGVIIRQVDRPNAHSVRSFAKISVATIHESLGKETNSVMHHSIRPIKEGMKLLGTGITVDSFPADNLTVHIAMALCKPGDILVVNGHDMPTALFGSQMAFQAVQQGIAGIVVDGAIRDSQEIKRMGFPCFAKYITPFGPVKSTLGSINVAIQCGGVIVNPGDLIVGDDDGVVVVPKAMLARTLQRSKHRIENEKERRELYIRGATSMSLDGYDKLVGLQGTRQRNRGTNEMNSLGVSARVRSKSNRSRGQKRI